MQWRFWAIVPAVTLLWCSFEAIMGELAGEWLNLSRLRLQH